VFSIRAPLSAVALAKAEALAKVEASWSAALADCQVLEHRFDHDLKPPADQQLPPTLPHARCEFGLRWQSAAATALS
jgi:hypothetical protein